LHVEFKDDIVGDLSTVECGAHPRVLCAWCRTTGFHDWWNCRRQGQSLLNLLLCVFFCKQTQTGCLIAVRACVGQGGTTYVEVSTRGR